MAGLKFGFAWTFTTSPVTDRNGLHTFVVRESVKPTVGSYPAQSERKITRDVASTLGYTPAGGPL
ncbi:unannotated protein [freshwater metagenome]|uniref:Unannotated protein n=1 Tax=freshwater metagenome TaxID=449393 RepID=A0A6J7UPR7_9ZZZZ